MTEFEAFPKIPRLRRDVVISEKIDGSNAAVVIVRSGGDVVNAPMGCAATVDDQVYFVYAQSRKRFISPEDDNFGFARWVFDNAVDLVSVLGEGTHYGEWWGSGIQRGYGLEKGDKRFSLFNRKRWGHFDDEDSVVPGLGVVPEICTGPLSDDLIDYALGVLRNYGSEASPGFMNPEGIVVYHSASNHLYKVLLENDEIPKGLVA